MSKIEEMRRYIARTHLDPDDRFYLGSSEAFELSASARESKDFPLDVIALAFNYGKAKGYRAAKAKRRAAV